MDNTANNTSSTTTSPTLCTAGCGFFGSVAFNNMCSQCYKINNKTTNTTSVASAKPPPPTKNETVKSPSHTIEDKFVIPAIEKSRKHLRSPSPETTRSAPTSTIASPAVSTIIHESSMSATNSPLPSPLGEKPVQTNKGRCFTCRLKVPLAKQAANKCRCGYVFCDRHRYPDRHDCDVDFVKLDREILAKNNPKLHERPRGGRSFQRIDSL